MSEYIKKTWVDDEYITSKALNNIETGITEAKKEAENSRIAAEHAQTTKGTSNAPNLLDNSYFVKAVAQAGVSTTHGGSEVYAVDRWILSGTARRAEDGSGLVLNGTMTQKLETAPTGKVSAFVGMAAGTAAITYANGAVKITSAGGTIAWAALYEGSFTAANRPVYMPKGYAAELLECKRYFRYVRGGGIVGFLTSKSGRFGLPVDVPMRVTPTATVVEYGHIRAEGKEITPTGIAVSGSQSSVILFDVNYAEQSDISNRVGVLASDAYFKLSADL